MKSIGEGLTLGNLSRFPKNRPLLQYNWRTTVSATGIRSLKDSGTSPKYNAELFYGRGVKFNGTDQYSSMSTIAGLDEITICINAEMDSTNGRIIEQYCSPTLRVGLYKKTNTFVLTIYDGSSYVNINTSVLADGIHNCVISVDASRDMTLLVDGVSYALDTIGTPTGLTSTDTYIGSDGGVSHFFDGILGNLIEYMGILTPEQITYQFNYPEKFLYREDNILKSKILTQAEIDNVVAYLPLCETDKYVRDLANYSEGVDLIIGTAMVGTAGGSSILDNGDGTFTLTYTADDVQALIFGVVDDTQGSRNGRLEVLSMSHPMTIRRWYDGSSSHMIGQDLNVGINLFSDIGARTGTNKVCLYPAQSAEERTLVFKLLEFYEVTATYPITNYTDSVRDDAKNLSTGLQTCFWKRDLLGVPYASSFDRLECDGVGYADTGWIPPFDSDFTIETILPKATTNYYEGIGIEDERGSLWVRRTQSGSVNTRYGLGDVPSVKNANEKCHIVIVLDGATSSMATSVDGVQLDTLSTDTDANIVKTFHLGHIHNNVSKNMNGELRLFKIHTTPQDPLALYESAVKKGLLS